MFEKLRASLELDASGFKSEIQESQKELSSFGDRAASLGSSMQRIGAGMAAGISLPIAGIGAASLKTASEVEEMESKFNEVFQSSSDEVAAWADTHADEIGRSQNQLQEYAAGFGSLLDAMGASTDQTADMSKELTSLTADLASFENMSERQVQSKLESALSGQSRAVRDFGVSLSAAREEQILMNEGLAESREEATQAELAQARLIAIQKDTATAAGDAARTSDSYANSVRALKANMEDMRAEIGQHLLPVATSLVNRLQGLTSSFGNLSSSQQKVIIAFGALAASLGPIAIGLGTVLTMIPAMQAGWAALAAVQWSTVIPAAAATVAAYAPIIATFGAVAASAAALWYAWDNNLGNIQGHTRTVVSGVVSAFESLRTGVQNAINGVRSALQPFVGWLQSTFGGHLNAILSEAGQTFSVWGETVSSAVTKVRNTLQPFVSWLSSGFSAAMTGALTAATAAWDRFGNEIMAVVDFAFSSIRGVVETSMNAIRTGIVATLRVLRGDFQGAFSAIEGFWRSTFSGILSFIQGWGSQLTAYIAGIAGDVVSAFQGMGRDAVSEMRSMASNILSEVSSLASTFVSEIAGLASSVTSEFATLASNAVSEVSSMASNILSEISSLGSDMISAISSIDVAGAFRDIFSDAGSAGSEAFKSAFNSAIPSSIDLPSTEIGGESIGGGSLNLPSLDSGGVIEEDGLYYGHAGEHVFNPAKADKGNPTPSGGVTIENIEIYANSKQEGREAMKGLHRELRAKNLNRSL